ncbi:tyrosine-type recombinase/integrase [Undibacterium oligocarboniphilum]|uniref:Site-specific integrase n=1 Tax=Undibacterium oligocarboniphilum TaxID=666702 RepID=A0A850QJS4_9BURK|nr:site-specific integrase [Undibacterium oligocarboniphilum]MBC3871731.1 site-specific integrase [Undibacterium oligocarboniphilum]NVO79367.1 site-specific integrase [Undibacterium oligocarboniphilum]
MHTQLSPADRLLWLNSPLPAFTAWISSEEFKKTAFRDRRKSTLSANSVYVYQVMFQRFLNFLAKRGCSLQHASAEDIYAFLTERQDGAGLVLESEIQYRYLRLLERVFTHLQCFPRPTDNLLFGPLKEQYKLRGRNLQTVALTDAEKTSFLACLPVDTSQVRSNRSLAGWKKRRDRALQCTLLGAGLTVQEVVHLNMQDIDPLLQTDGTLRITVHNDGTSAHDAPVTTSHTTFMHADLCPELLCWLNERRTLFPTCSLVFPGKDGKVMDKTSVYRQIRKTFDAAGIAIARRGGRTLRNTYAVSELSSGTATAELVEKMGLFEERSLEIYANAANGVN